MKFIHVHNYLLCYGRAKMSIQLASELGNEIVLSVHIMKH